MKKTFFITTVLAGIICFTSCKKYLDLKPKGYVIPQTTEDFDRILNNPTMAKNIANHLDMLTDDYFVKGSGKAAMEQDNSSESRIYLWKAEIYTTPDDMKYNAFWNLLYNNAYQYNAIINGIETATGGTPAKKKIIMAKAKLGRALTFWYLVNLYTQPYQTQTAATDPGIPLITSNDIAAPLPGRGTVKETYDFILKDLQEAIPDLPVSVQDPYQLSKAAGYSALARTYLMMGDYANAGKAANDALSFNNNLIDYNTEYEETDGQIFPKEDGKYADMLKDPENIFVQHYSYTRGMAYQYVSREAVNLFDAADLRHIYLTLETEPDPVTNKPDSNYLFMGAMSFNYNISFTSPEMLLIRAECNARQGKVADAMEDINRLRQHRIKTTAYKALTAADKKAATRLVLEERRRELLFRGSRWFDMRRLNSDPDFGFTARHYFQDGTSIALAPGSKRYTLFLPISALTANIVQNPE